MAQIMWFLTRASGIVALLLIVAAVADGLIFSGREGGRRLRPAWWMDLHRGLGGYALVFTGLHMATAFGADIGSGIAQVLVPGVAKASTTAYSLGVVAFYIIAVTVFSSWPRKRFGRTTWHVLHLLSIPAAVMAGVHAYQLGSDASRPFYVGLSLVATFATMYPAVLRVTGIARRRVASSNAA